MGFRFVVMFIDSFMDDVTYVRDGEVLDDQTVAHTKPNYWVLSLAEQGTCKCSQYTTYPCHQSGRDSSVRIATRYGLDGPGTESRWARYFPHPSKPAL